jgi:hypothetical protein
MVACEKHGLGGVLRGATKPWRVPLATMGGTYSHSFAGDIVEWIAGYDDRPVYIFYLGDYDPTGVQIPQWLHRDMYAIALGKVPDYDRGHYADNVRIIRLAVNNLAQAREYGGISRPTKREDNTHATAIDWPANEDSVEVDSIPPEQLQAMVREAIEGVFDQRVWTRSLATEQRQRGALENYARNFRMNGRAKAPPSGGFLGMPRIRRLSRRCTVARTIKKSAKPEATDAKPEQPLPEPEPELRLVLSPLRQAEVPLHRCHCNEARWRVAWALLVPQCS